MKTVISLVLIALLFSCSRKQEETAVSVDISEINGYWENDKQIIAVWDSLMLNPTQSTSGFQTYTIDKSLLTLEDGTSVNLLKLNQDSLVFSAGNETYRYTKAVPVNSVIEFETISYNTGPCEGECPVFGLTIDRNGQVEYVGEFYSELKGKHQGQLSKQFVQELNKLISYIEFEHLKERELPPADNAVAELDVVFADKKAGRVKGDLSGGRYSILLRIFNNFDDLVELKNKIP